MDKLKKVEDKQVELASLLITKPGSIKISMAFEPEIQKKSGNKVRDLLREKEIVAMMNQNMAKLFRLQYENPELLDKLLTF